MEKSHLIILILIITALVTVSIITYFGFYYYDRACLENIAVDYCREKGFAYSSIQISKYDGIPERFHCEISFNPRNQKQPKMKTFYYLEEELKECKK